MLQTAKFGIRVVVLGALVLAGAGHALAQGTTAKSLEAVLSQTAPAAEMDSDTFFRTYPVALVYRGLAQLEAKDYDGAIASWEE